MGELTTTSSTRPTIASRSRSPMNLARAAQITGMRSKGSIPRPIRRQGRNFLARNLVIHFQNGTIPEAGYNGVTQEVLLAIVADRLRSFQAGPFSCRENALALTKIEEAQHWLQQRTLARMRRGVEGTHRV